jgi:hypothetical protein
MSKILQFPEPPDVCLALGYTTRRNIGPRHWMCCDAHKTCWDIGENLFSDWLTEPEKTHWANARLLSTYQTVEPWFPKGATA